MVSSLRTGLLLAATIGALCLLVPVAMGVSYSPLVHQEPGEEELARPGTKVYLFHSGTPEIRQRVQVDDVLTVMRLQRTCRPMEAGKVRVLAFLGETYLETEVVSGGVKPNDVAQSGTVYFLVLAAQPCETR